MEDEGKAIEINRKGNPMVENSFSKHLQPRWYEAIPRRRSRRQYTGETLDEKALARLEALAEKLNADFSGARIEIVNNPPTEVFKGAVGPYGKVTGAPAYAAFIGNSDDPNYQEKVGYLGQCLILEATARGIGTCWISGFFKRGIVLQQIDMQPKEEVLAISPLGYAAEEYNFTETVLSVFGYHHRRKELADLCPDGMEETWPAWVKTGLEAARLAPSAVNRQPWRFFVQDEKIKIAIAGRESSTYSKRLDCGIAMLHLELGALHHGLRGKWDYLPTPDVAVFSP